MARRKISEAERRYFMDYSRSQQIGSHTARKISEYLIHYPEDSVHRGGKSVRTLKEAAAYIDRYEGSEDPAARMKKIPRVASSR